MKLDFYGLKKNGGPGGFEPDLERELASEDAEKLAKAGQLVLVKVWLKTEGAVDLTNLDRRLAEALAPLGLR